MSSKAFDLVSTLERSILLADIRGKHALPSANPVDIVCFDCCTKNLFIGTTNGFIIHYIIDERKTAERVIFKSHLQGKKAVAKKPLQLVKYVPTADQVIILVDGTICVFDTTRFDLSPSHERFKNVQTFCVNENKEGGSPFGQQVCIASRKRHIQLYNITAEKWIHIRDIGLPELPRIVSMDSSTVCVALQTKYVCVNVETSKLTELFAYDNEADTPFVKRVAPGEFFLGGPSDLGIFATVSGVSQRPPIQLKSGTFSLAFSSPYIVSLNSEFVVVYNALNQQQKQALQFQRGVSLQEQSDRVFVASAQDIYALVPVPWQKQVDGLLLEHKVEEALKLAEVSYRNSGLSQSQFNEINNVILQKAGFIEFSLYNFDEAGQYLKTGGVDLREVISLFPGLLSVDSQFTRSRPPLHDFADVNQITKGNLEKSEDCTAWLVRFLESVRCKMSEKKDVHTALMKLYAEKRPSDLLRLLQSGYQGHHSDTVDTLQTFGRFHALAVYYQQARELDKSFTIWSRLVNKEIEDESFDPLGLSYFSDVLCKTTDATLLLNYAPVVLEKDPVIGAQMFTKRFDSGIQDKRLNPESTIEFLTRFPEALTYYLEHLVLSANQQVESFHSHLAMVYLDNLFSAKQLNNKVLIESLRKKLQSFLRQSDKYSVSLILGRVERDDWLLPEAAILHGKAGNDSAALEILVNELKDYKGAESFCVNQSANKTTTIERQRLFETLLHLYLSKSKDNERMRVYVIDLLNNPKAVFNAAKVAELIPDDWSIALLSKFMLNSVRSSLHDGRQARIASQLAYWDYFLANKDYLSLRSTTISLTDNKRCESCHQLFKESAFVRQADGRVVHISCAKT